MPIKWSFSFRQEDYVIAYFGLHYYSYHHVIHSAQHAHNVPICCPIIWGCQLISAVHISWSHLSNSTVTHLPRFLAAVLNMMFPMPLVYFCCCFVHPRHLPTTTYFLQIHHLHHFIISSDVCLILVIYHHHHHTQIDIFILNINVEMNEWWPISATAMHKDTCYLAYNTELL